MTTYYPHLAAKVRRQATDVPQMYGDFDFAATPERFTTDPRVTSALPRKRGRRQDYLGDSRLVALARTALYLADVPADRVAALSARYSVTELVGLIRLACREGVENVPEAPSELAELLSVMEKKPDWIDFDLIERGAARARLSAGLIAPFVTRGAAARMGVDIGAGDYARIAATGPFLAGRVLAVAIAGRRPRIRTAIDRYLTGQVRRRLDIYGIPEYTTDHRDYTR